MAALIYAGFFLAALVAASTPTSSVTSTTKPCVDKLTNCPAYGPKACVDPHLLWAFGNCRKSCGLCMASVKDCGSADRESHCVSYDDKHPDCCPEFGIREMLILIGGGTVLVIFLAIFCYCCSCCWDCLTFCWAKMMALKTRNTDMTTTATTTVVNDCPSIEDVSDGGMTTACGGGLELSEENKPASFNVDVGKRKGDLHVSGSDVPVIENGSDGGKPTASVGGLHVSEEEKPASVNVDVGKKKTNLRVSGSDVPVIENGSDGGKPTASIGGLHVWEEEKPASLNVDVGKRKGDIRVSGSGIPMVMTANTSPGVYPAYGQPHPLGQPLPMAPYLGIPPPYPGPTPPAPDEEQPPPAYSTLN